jgi:hypothetical protein
MIQKGSRLLLNYNDKISWYTILDCIDDSEKFNSSCMRGRLPKLYRVQSEVEDTIRYFYEDHLNTFVVKSPLLLELCK